MIHIIGFDQPIASELPFPGGLPCGDETGAELSIRILAPAANTGEPLYRREQDGALVFSAPGVGTYRCTSDGIAVAACPGGEPRTLIDLLIATALPAVLWIQGRLVLHAAGVVPGGAEQAIAIAGASGAGKSAVASQLLAAGGSLVGDDSLAMALEGTEPSVCGLAAGVHVRRRGGDDRQFVPVAPGRALRRAPLAAILVLRSEGEPGFTRLGGLAALEAVLGQQHRPRIPAALDRRGTVLAEATRLASRVAVLAWRREPGAPLTAEENAVLGALAAASAPAERGA